MRTEIQQSGSAAEGGFTLVEMLVAMVVALLILGALESFIVLSLKQTNTTESQAVATQAAQGAMQQLTNDVRQAQNIPDAAAANSEVNDAPVVISYTTGAAAGFSAKLYIPTSGSTAQGTAVTWTCTAAAGASLGSCTRTVGAATRTEISGVISATITPQSASGATLGSCVGDPTGNAAVLPACSGVVQTGSPNAVYPSNVQLSINVSTVSLNVRTQTVSGVSHGLTLNDSVQLRNYL